MRALDIPSMQALETLTPMPGTLAVVNDEWYAYYDGWHRLDYMAESETTTDVHIHGNLNSSTEDYISFDSATSGTTRSGSTISVNDLFGSFEQTDGVEQTPPHGKDLVDKTFGNKILEIASMVVGEENCSIDDFNDQPHLILKWPIIEINNRRNQRHMIKDMYVALGLDTKSFIGDMFGDRGIISLAEYLSNYKHSHLPGNYTMSGFCTGADGINDLLAEISMIGCTDNNFDIKLEGLIHQIKAFLMYESLEGVPHRRIANIFLRGSGSAHVHYREIRNTMTQMKDELGDGDIELSFDFNTGEAHLIDTEWLEDLLCIHSSPETHQVRLPDGTFADPYSTRDQTGGFHMEGGFFFKGQLIQTYVEEARRFETKQDNAKRYCNRKIFERFQTEIEQRANNQFEEILLSEYQARRKAETERPTKDYEEFTFSNPVRISQEA